MTIARQFLVWLMTASALMADSPAEPEELEFTCEGGSGATFMMMPPKYNKDHEVEREGFGIAYRVGDDGIRKEAYRTDGWYSFEVYISKDARYLVRMGPWSFGREPAEDDLAVAFYKDGKLLKKYSTAALVKDKSKVVTTVSHYFWRAPVPPCTDEAQLERLRLRIEPTNIFKLHTIDGWTYSFDVTTGKIKATTKTKG